MAAKTTETFNCPLLNVCSDKLNIFIGAMLFIMDDMRCGKSHDYCKHKNASDNLITWLKYMHHPIAKSVWK